MRMFLISDNVDTKTGMRLAGIEGVVVHTREEVIEALCNATNDYSIGVILITELLVELCPDVISDMKLNRTRPLVVEIPDRHGTRRPHDYIMHYINQAIGLKL